MLAAPELDFCAHHLRSLRRYTDHVLSEPEERMVAEKDVTGVNAWVRLFSELSASITVDLPDQSGATLEAGLSLLTDPDRDVRESAARL